MDYDTIAWLRKNSGAWRLLSSDNVALVLGFLADVFIDDNLREISETDLIDRLDDTLYAHRQRLGDDVFPKPTKAYLADWAQPDKGWLRRYYPTGSDEPHYDATPEVELAVSWVRDLGPRDFVGTESRLSTIIDLLRQMVYGAESDPNARRAELLRRRADIDTELARLDRGEIELLGPVAQQDRYQQFAKMARELLADFRQVEENFRRLDRDIRAKIASFDGSKAELLDDVLGSRTSIDGSAQGQSFAAFFDFLLSPQRIAEFTELLERVSSVEALDIGDQRLRLIHHSWLGAGESTQATVRLLSEQLRKFLDDQAWLENRRIMDLVHSIQGQAIALRDMPQPDVHTEVPASRPELVLPMERPLYEPQTALELDSTIIEPAEVAEDDSALFDQVYVDPVVISRSVRSALQESQQVGLARLIEISPVEQGVAELVTYMSLKDPTFETVFDEAVRETVHITAESGAGRTVRIPRVTYVRTAKGEL